MGIVQPRIEYGNNHALAVFRRKRRRIVNTRFINVRFVGYRPRTRYIYRFGFGIRSRDYDALYPFHFLDFGNVFGVHLNRYRIEHGIVSVLYRIRNPLTGKRLQKICLLRLNIRLRKLSGTRIEILRNVLAFCARNNGFSRKGNHDRARFVLGRNLFRFHNLGIKIALHKLGRIKLPRYVFKRSVCRRRRTLQGRVVCAQTQNALHRDGRTHRQG